MFRFTPQMMTSSGISTLVFIFLGLMVGHAAEYSSKLDQDPWVLVIDQYALNDEIVEDQVVLVTDPNTAFILEDLNGSYAGSINLTEEVDTYEGTFRIRLRDKNGVEQVFDILEGRVQVYEDMEIARQKGFLSKRKI